MSCLLWLDEPSMRLPVLIVEQMFSIIAELRGEGKTILLIERNAHEALPLADRVTTELGSGRVVHSGADGDPMVREALGLGVERMETHS
ncbi:hypothetical protein [uncultured Variovorax sp.]|jgi:branched-chain amino acid transport system ATP-binding protein|uniref:hypothetical protein n=1 Tax=uncultured Variovorax sp. TaxID=114708 RepID=UPI00263154B7|nr:hypothetical protein [uncultured Variovorax sp.]